MQREERLGLFYILAATMGYAFLPIFGRAIYPASADILTPTDVAFWRFVVATPVIWLIVQARPSTRNIEPENRRELLWFVFLGFLYSLSAIGAFAGLRYINANTFTALFYSYPAMVAVLGLFLGRRLPAIAWIALAGVLVGVFLTVPEFKLSGSDTVFLGVVIALMTAFSVAVYYQFIQNVMQNTKSTIRGTAWIITWTLASIALFIPFFGLHVPPNIRSWLILLGLGIVSTALPIFWVNVGVMKIGATRASIISAMQPVVTLILSPILLGESSSLIQWLGAALIIGSVIMLELRPKQKQAQPT